MAFRYYCFSSKCHQVSRSEGSSDEGEGVPQMPCQRTSGCPRGSWYRKDIAPLKGGQGGAQVVQRVRLTVGFWGKQLHCSPLFHVYALHSVQIGIRIRRYTKPRWKWIKNQHGINQYPRLTLNHKSCVFRNGWSLTLHLNVFKVSDSKCRRLVDISGRIFRYSIAWLGSVTSLQTSDYCCTTSVSSYVTWWMRTLKIFPRWEGNFRKRVCNLTYKLPPIAISYLSMANS